MPAEMPSWSKSPEALVALFEEVFPGPPAVARKMFGFPAGFVNGNMFMGLHQADLIVRLPADQRAELLAQEGAHIFEPMAGRPMAEYVAVPPGMLVQPATLEPWVARALEYGASLPPKAPKAPKPKSTKPKAKP